MIGPYAYNWHSDPPEFDLAPNVFVQLTMGFIMGKYTLDTWGIEIPASQIWSVPLRENVSYSSLYRQTPPMYFYVPKGTKSIEYYFAPTPFGKAGPHIVVGPDGGIVKYVQASGDYVLVPVPDGMDGKVWSFASPAKRRDGQFALGLYYFYNVPNYLSGSPNAMLLPKDIVAKDGLKTIK